MPNLRRTVAPIALIFLAALIVWPLRDVFDAFLESRSSASPITWSLGMTWAFDFAWSVVLGALLGGIMRTRSALVWAAAAGIAYGALNFAMTQHHFSASLTWIVYAWIYGQYAVSCVGAIFGAWIALTVMGNTPAGQRRAA